VTLAIELVTLGQLVKAIGLRGELKLRETPDFWSEALASAHLFLLQDDEPRAIEVCRQRRHSAGMTAVLLDGVEDRTAAEALVGARVLVDVERLDVAPPDSTRPFQVKGFSVLLPDGSELGRVDDLMRLPANDVFVVRGASREYLIPDAPHVVKELDLERRTLRIEPLPGLLEL
jgi:16S rRNA processing protein RimM